MTEATWKFDRGVWSVAEDTIFCQIQEDETRSLKEVYRQAGYELEPEIDLGDRGEDFSAEIYLASKKEHSPSAQSPYLVHVSLPTETQSIYVTDFPSLVMLLSQLSSIISNIKVENRNSPRI